ncbi:hypothetical protein D3879_19715 [Pseudomonas cavernicola]|uniref:Uncharacterized protein n=1 Tax=Pseudomonas cavernicola TaxID=2320866 RepID=A0A418XCJ5_9PSED|nr:hypothetical protein [Pseudomonas cavernicola]RJG10255.1 hypothetical protein D3879_19715 [Pseudomonas cavernicola]
MGRLALTRKEAQGLRFTIKPEHVAELGDLIRDGITITFIDLDRSTANRMHQDACSDILGRNIG